MVEHELKLPDDYKYDTENMRQAILQIPEQAEQGYKLAEALDFSKAGGKHSGVIIAGMGGSALIGSLLQSYLYRAAVPVFVVRDYFLPEWANKKTLVIAASYSGNTEETLNVYRMALRKGCRVVVIASGGALLEAASKHHVPIIKIPSGYQPRMTLGYQFFPLLNVLSNSGIIEDKKEDMKKTVEMLHKPVFREKAAELAEKIQDRIPIIYASNQFASIAYKWKINFNENSKQHAFYNVFPELNHNEMVGYTLLKAEYYAIIIKDEEDYHRIKKRMDITKEIIKKKGVKVTEIALAGPSLLTKMFSAIYIGDWTSYFLALRNKTDPTPVDVVEDFKKKL